MGRGCQSGGREAAIVRVRALAINSPRRTGAVRHHESLRHGRGRGVKHAVCHGDDATVRQLAPVVGFLSARPQHTAKHEVPDYKISNERYECTPQGGQAFSRGRATCSKTACSPLPLDSAVTSPRPKRGDQQHLSVEFELQIILEHVALNKCCGSNVVVFPLARAPVTPRN